MNTSDPSRSSESRPVQPDQELATRLRENAVLREERLQLRRQLDERERELDDMRVRLLRQASEQVESRQALNELHQYHRLLLDSTAEGIYGVDRFGRCSFVNRAALALVGFDPDQLLGQDIADLIHRRNTTPDDQCRGLDEVLKTGIGSHCADGMMMREDGSLFAAEWSCYPVIEARNVVGAVVVFRDVTEARALAARLSYHASHDALTGLVNRREFELRLERALADSEMARSQHVLLYLDLDQFKVVNDTCGHNAGDELLRQLATELQGSIRRGDILARLGGDEFGVLLLHCDVGQAMPIADKLLKAVRDYRLYWNSQSFAVGVSIGVVGIDEESNNLPRVLSAADSACYAAKEAGRDRIVLYQPDDAEVTRRKGMMQWVHRLQHALDEDRFVLFAQPIRPIGTQAPDASHYEVLLRMSDTDGSLIPPGAFLPAAERYDLSARLDRWVIRHTLDWLGSHPDHLAQLQLCSINLSGHSLSDARFLDFLIEEIGSREIPGNKLCFEITETAAVADIKRAQSFVGRIAELGCRFALDDFGSGMSSFGYLKHLPVDYLKIDGNFIRDITIDDVDRALTRSINEVGHVMGKLTIAEFVENDATLSVLQGIGVDYAQGYGISRPVRIDELLSLGDR